MKKVNCILSLWFIFCFCVKAQIQPNLYKNVDEQAMNQWVDSIFDSMTLDEKIGQLFMVITDPGSAYHNRILNNIKNQKIGGVLFSGGALADQAASINLYQKNSRIPLLISFDGEWGLNMRLKDTPRFPRNMMLGAIQDNDLIRQYGEEVGRQCNELGVHINFAPVLDVNINPANPVIGTRAFGDNPVLVAEKGIAYSTGLEKRKVISSGKHFPGHGDTAVDSHFGLPHIPHSRAHLDSIELYPFKQYIQAGFAGIMTGHLSVPVLDSTSNKPTSLSPVIVTDLLTNELGFRGLKFTDALVMKGATDGGHSVCVESLLAGNDVLVSPERPTVEFDAVKKAVEQGIISRESIEEKCLKILRYKYIVGLNNYTPIKTNGLATRINSSDANWLIQKLTEAAMTVLKNNNNVLPLKQLGGRKMAVVSFGETTQNEFQQTMALYNHFDFYRLGADANSANTFAKLKNYDVIIAAIHSNKVSDYPALQTLAAEKEVHLCFFMTPYQMAKYKPSILSAKSVVLAYENTNVAQKAAAEVIMGGLSASGKLPVTISGLFDFGTGFDTKKTRFSYQPPRAVGMSASVLNRIENIVKKGIEEQAFPGCQVFVAKDGVVVYNKSFGHFDYAKTHPVQNSDIYDLASVTKSTATVAGVMKLYDMEKFGLQDHLSQYIPELQNTDKDCISIKNTLFHQTGLPSFYPFYQLLIDTNSYEGSLFAKKRDLTYRILYDKNVYMRTDFEFDSKMVSQTKQKGIGKQVAENFFIADDFDKIILEKIAGVRLRNNTNYLYSDLNFILLKQLVENITGQTFDNFLEREFFSNLGAHSTTFLPLKKFDRKIIAPTEHDEFWRNQILIGHVHDEAAAVMGGVSGSSGLFSNANDLGKLLQLFLNNGEYGGERYISQATVRTFTQTKSPISRRGLGFDKPDKEKEVGATSEKAPASTYGHTGFTGTCFWVDPDNKLIYIFLSNRVYPSRTYTKLGELGIRSRIHDVIYESMNQ